MTPRARRSWWVIGLTVLVAAEVGLRVFVMGYQWWTTRTRVNPINAGGFTILCLGDSLVYGVGADPQHSYPRQLTALLEAAWPEQPIRIINAGVPGVNSSQVLHQLQGNLDEANPDLVLLVVGLADWARFQEVDFDAFTVGEASRLVQLGLRMDRWFSHVQLYRMVKHVYLHQGWRRAARAVRGTPAQDAQTELTTTHLLRHLRELVEVDPVLAQWILAELGGEDPDRLSTEERNHRAVIWVQHALQRTPDTVKVLIELGHRFRWFGRDAIARQLHERALAVASDERDRLWAQAELHEARRAFAQAQPLWEQLIERDPTHPSFVARLAYVHMKHGAADKAMALARTAITMHPEEAGAYHVLGAVFRGQERWEEAQAMFRRAVELEPLRTRSWFLLAEASEALGQVDVARQGWRVVFHRNHSPLALHRLGRTYQDPDRGREAMRALLEEARTAAFQDPSSWRPYERMITQDIRQLSPRLLEANLAEIVDRVTRRKIRLGLVTYPNFPKRWRMNAVLRRVATGQPEVLLVDAADELSDQFADPDSGLVSEDGVHPNAQGYEVLARHVMQTLVESGMLQDLVR